MTEMTPESRIGDGTLGVLPTIAEIEAAAEELRAATTALGEIEKERPARMTFWRAGGLHAHITHPDGVYEHLTWRLVGGDIPWWEIDALTRELEDTYGKGNVEVNDRAR